MFAYHELTFAGIVSLLLAPPIALMAALLMRRRSLSSWPVAAVVLIPALIAGTLLACVAGGLDRYLPTNLGDIVDDMGPNLILYAPLGFILAVRGLSLRRTLVTALTLSSAVELYQALFTTQVCAPRDVIANATGALLGAAAVQVLTRRNTRLVATPIPPQAGVGETSKMATLDTLSVED